MNAAMATAMSACTSISPPIGEYEVQVFERKPDRTQRLVRSELGVDTNSRVEVFYWPGNPAKRALAAANSHCGFEAGSPADMIDFEIEGAAFGFVSYGFTCPKSEKDTE